MGIIDWIRPEPEVIEKESSLERGNIVRYELDSLVRRYEQAPLLFEELDDAGEYAKCVTTVNRDVVAYKELQDNGAFNPVIATCVVPSDATVVIAGGKIRVDELYIAKLSRASPHRGEMRQYHLNDDPFLETATSPYAGATYEEGKMHGVVGGVSTHLTESCDEHGIYVHPKLSSITV